MTYAASSRDISTLAIGSMSTTKLMGSQLLRPKTMYDERLVRMLLYIAFRIAVTKRELLAVNRRTQRFIRLSPCFVRGDESQYSNDTD